MNLLLLDPEELDPARRARLAGRRAKHLLRVLKVTPGRTLRAGLVRGPRCTATVISTGDGEVVVELAQPPGEPAEDAGVPARPAVDLVVALPRPQVLHRVLQFAAAMNVARIDLTNAWRVEKSFFQSPSAAPEALARHLRLGAEQGATTWVPEVALHPRLVPLIERLGAAPRAGRHLLAHPGAPLLEAVWPRLPKGDGRTTLAIGPEGGWIDREVETWGRAGFRPVSLGGWVLRVEAALVAALSQLSVLHRQEEVC